jgi:hypothetical protein
MQHKKHPLALHVPNEHRAPTAFAVRGVHRNGHNDMRVIMSADDGKSHNAVLRCDQHMHIPPFEHGVETKFRFGVIQREALTPQCLNVSWFSIMCVHAPYTHQ